MTQRLFEGQLQVSSETQAMLQRGVKPRFDDFVKSGFSFIPMEKAENLATVGGRLRAALRAAGKLGRDLASHFQVSEQAVSQWLRNETKPEMAKIFALAEFLGVRAEWILDGSMPRVAALPPKAVVDDKSSDDVLSINIHNWPLDVPILGGGACGEDGVFEFNGQTLGYARRPPKFQGAKDIYALYVQGESMSPWRETGDLVYVHPHQPVKIGDYVVVEMVSDKPGDPTRPAFIKRLVRRTADKLVLEQYHPREEKTLPAKKIKAIHRIIGWSELMGI